MSTQEPNSDGKQHVSVAIAGHVDSGKSTTTGHLLFELGGISEREMQKLKDEAKAVGKGSFAFAFHMDRQKEERARGVTITVTTKEFFTDNFHYTILDCPGHASFLKNMISGAAQADVAVLMIPADGNFTTAIAKGDHKKGEVVGQTRQHALLLNLLGVKQLIVCVNKMDCDTAGYKEDRYIECRDEAINMLVKVGWKKDFIKNQVPIIPISGWIGDNLIKESDKMPWWKGVDLKIRDETVHVHTLLDALDKMVRLPERCPDKPLRVPISNVLKIKGVGDVLTGRVEQGLSKPGQEVVFLPSHSAGTPCDGKVFTVEMHHKSQPQADPGKNVGLNVKGLPKANMPKAGDVMILKSEFLAAQPSEDEIKKGAHRPLRACKSFVAQVQIMQHPGQLKVGYTPIAFVRTGRSAVRMTKINWKMGKETGGKRMEDPPHLKSNEVAEVVFEPAQPFVVEPFKQCEGLGRVAIMEGNTVVMLGKAIDVTYKEGK